MDEQQRAPILDIVRCYWQDRPTAFYFPGHRGRMYDRELGELWGEHLWRGDLPELPGVDGAVLDSERLAAALAGADSAWFLTNGSTIGVHCMVLAFPGAKILVGRNCHRSAIGGMVLAGTVPVYLPTEIDPVTGVDLGVSVQTLESALGEHPDAKAVLLVSPNYFGVCGDVGGWAKLCHDRSIPLLIDSAHGAHLGFHRRFPPSPLALGADVVVQSTHKTATSLTQSGVLYLKSNLVRPETIGCSLDILKSTSPSLLLLASLDGNRRKMYAEGKKLLDRLLDFSERLRSSLPWLICYDDPSRIIALPASGTGFELDQWLCGQSPPLIGELPTFDHLVFALTVGTDTKDIDRLLSVLANYPGHLPKKTRPPLENLSITVPVFSPRDAYFCPGERVEPQNAIDRVSRSIVCPYPPGIPLLFPGETIAKKTIEYLQQTIEMGGIVPGWEQGIDVIKNVP